MTKPEHAITDLLLFDLSRSRALAEEAARAISGLWDDNRKTFWRSTVQRDRDKDVGEANFFPTVTLRCIDALLLFLLQFPEWASEFLRQKLIDVWLPSVVEHDQKTLRSSLNSGAKDREGLNLFTLS